MLLEITDTLEVCDDVCPYTLVKSKLALEELQSGQVPEIHLGNSESASNAPRSIAMEDHHVVQGDKSGPSHWVVMVRRA